jgi:heavy metal translocating P-type ATPase
MAAIGQATKHGVIIKSGDALERMGKVDTIAFDKTGTLTHGNLMVSDVAAINESIGVEGLLSLAASAESNSEHPLGKAVVAYAKERLIAVQAIENFVMIPGKGISTDIGDKHVICGNSSFLQENGIALDGASDMLERFREQGKATIIVSLDKECLGIIALSDTLRKTSKSMVQDLKDAGAEVVLLTGDNKQAANYFSEQIGITNVHAELLPAQKVDLIKEMQNNGKSVCMIGDGVNDAPALKTADVGVAMGDIGSDIAIEAADIALMGDDIGKIPYLKRLSNATVKLIKFNIALSMAINVLAVGLSIIAVLNPVTGALVHNIGSVIIVLNAALLYDRKYI